MAGFRLKLSWFMQQRIHMKYQALFSLKFLLRWTWAAIDLKKTLFVYWPTRMKKIVIERWLTTVLIQNVFIYKTNRSQICLFIWILILWIYLSFHRVLASFFIHSFISLSHSIYAPDFENTEWGYFFLVRPSVRHACYIFRTGAC